MPIGEHRPEPGLRLGRKGGTDKIAGLAAEGRGGTLSDDAHQADAAGGFRAIEQQDAGTQPVTRRAVGDQVTKVDHGHRRPAVVEETDTARPGLGQELDHREHFHHPPGFEGIATLTDLAQEEKHGDQDGNPALERLQSESAHAALQLGARFVELLDGYPGIAERFRRLLGGFAQLRQALADLLGAGGLRLHPFHHN